MATFDLADTATLMATLRDQQSQIETLQREVHGRSGDKYYSRDRAVIPTTQCELRSVFNDPGVLCRSISSIVILNFQQTIKTETAKMLRREFSDDIMQSATSWDDFLQLLKETLHEEGVVEWIDEMMVHRNSLLEQLGLVQYNRTAGVVAKDRRSHRDELLLHSRTAIYQTNRSYPSELNHNQQIAAKKADASLYRLLIFVTEKSKAHASIKKVPRNHGHLALLVLSAEMYEDAVKMQRALLHDIINCRIGTKPNQPANVRDFLDYLELQVDQLEGELGGNIDPNFLRS